MQAVNDDHNMTVTEIAEEITLLELPDPLSSTDKILFPAVPQGYAIEIIESSDESLVDKSGKLMRGDQTKEVYLTFQITEIETGAYALTKPLLLPVYKAYQKPTVSESEIEDAKKDFERLKYGIFVHYVPMTVYANGDKIDAIDSHGKVIDIDTLADHFDAKQFAADMHAFGAEYVVFTAWHWPMTPLFPSMTNRRWRDLRWKEAHRKSYSDRDVIGDLLDALEPYHIPLHLYVHPSEGKDLEPEEMALTYWEDEADNYAAWNRYSNELMFELCQRYGERLSGLWIDAFFLHIPAGERQETFKAYCRAINPKMILQLNVGLRESEHIEDPLPEHNGAEHRCWEFSHTADLEAIPLTKNQTAIVVASQWFTDTVKDKEIVMNPAVEIFRYTVGQASISQAGGFLASAGCYPNRPEDDLQGNLWQKDVRENFKKVNEYLAVLKETLIGTLPGKAFPTPAGKCVHELPYVSTESADGRFVYIHALNLSDNQIFLPAPLDGSVFATHAEVHCAAGYTYDAELICEKVGCRIEIPSQTELDAVDTVIVLERIVFIN